MAYPRQPRLLHPEEGLKAPPRRPRDNWGGRPSSLGLGLRRASLAVLALAVAMLAGVFGSPSTASEAI